MKFISTLLITVAALIQTVSAVAQTPAAFDNPGVEADPPQGEVGTLQRIALTWENQRGVFPNPYQYSISVTRYGEDEVLMGATAATDPKQYNIL